MIGVYDSGLGGLTVLSALRRAGVGGEIIYFADQAHVPYGDKSDAELHALLTTNLIWLRDHGASSVVMGCNTSCAVARRLGWPDVRFAAPVFDLIGNGARAVARGAFARVAVFATAATVRSGAYAHSIAAVSPQTRTFESAAPALVPLIEAGATAGDAVRRVLAELAAALPEPVEALVYGCTHYPLLDAQFARAFPGVVRIDPAAEQAAVVAREFASSGAPHTTYVTNGDVVAFERNVRRWTDDASGRVAMLEPMA